jgi:hypothetical protein
MTKQRKGLQKWFNGFWQSILAAGIIGAIFAFIIYPIFSGGLPTPVPGVFLFGFVLGGIIQFMLRGVTGIS